jgi:hypothetical protein
MRARLALALLVGVLCAAPQTAHAIPFGTDLSRPPSIQAGACPNFNPFQPQPTCAWYSVNLQTGESPFPPAGNGVVSVVRVRVGGSTGPMQVVVLRGLRNPNTTPSQPGNDFLFTGDAGYACCKAVALSQVFTPAPGAITTVPVNLPTRNDLAPDPTTNVYVGDFLALQVLRPDVRIPFAQDPGAIAGGYFPAWGPNEERAGVYGITGAAILLNGEWNPNAAAGNAIPGLGIVRFTNNILDVNVPGPGTLRVTDATGTVLSANHLGYVARKRKRKSRIKPVKLTTTKAGTVKVRIRPSKYGKKLLKRKSKLRVKLLVSFTPKGAPSAATSTKTVTLKAKKKRHRRAR